jgi:hypothetical protein
LFHGEQRGRASTGSTRTERGRGERNGAVMSGDFLR